MKVELKMEKKKTVFLFTSGMVAFGNVLGAYQLAEHSDETLAPSFGKTNVESHTLKKLTQVKNASPRILGELMAFSKACEVLKKEQYKGSRVFVYFSESLLNEWANAEYCSNNVLEINFKACITELTKKMRISFAFRQDKADKEYSVELSKYLDNYVRMKYKKEIRERNKKVGK